MILAHEEQLGVLSLAVEGPATMMETPAVHETANEQISSCGVRLLRVDLRDCTAMDSTFSGTLLSLKRKLEAMGGALTLVSPSPRVIELLREMGLEDFYEIEEADPPLGPSRELTHTFPSPTHPESVEELRRLILDAHEELAANVTLGPAVRELCDVVEELRRDHNDDGQATNGSVSSRPSGLATPLS